MDAEGNRAFTDETGDAKQPSCPACGGTLVEIRQKLQCSVCHTICETCCEGGPG